MSAGTSCNFGLLQVKKRISSKSDFIHFFHDFIHVNIDGAGADSRHSSDVNRKALSIYLFVASFKEISLKSDYIQFFFHDLIHIYSPRAGGIQPPRGQSFDVNRNFLSLRSSVTSFKS